MSSSCPRPPSRSRSRWTGPGRVRPWCSVFPGQGCSYRHARRVGEGPDAFGEGPAQVVELFRTDAVGEEEGHSELGEGELVGQPVELLLLELLAAEAEDPGLLQRAEKGAVETDSGPVGGGRGGNPQAGERRVTGVDDHRT